MPMLSEEADDAHLSEGERLEEEIGSVDHQIHICPQCGYMAKFHVGAWFSPYSQCGSCGYRAVRSSSVTLYAATYSEGGEVEVTTTCVHCGVSNTRIRHTPRLVASGGVSSGWGGGAGGGGGGGGGFGGGGSGGGGAGSSW
jgi:uncharacterized protein